jgi:predicted Zn-dependent peptidase
LERYFKTYYAPNNCVVVSGAIKTEEVKRLAIKNQNQHHRKSIEPVQTGERRITVQKEVATPYLMIGYHTPETKQDYYALNILSSILSSGKSSRLYASLVDENSLLRKYLQIMAIALILIFSMSML